MKKWTSLFVLVNFIVSCVIPPHGMAQTLTAVGLMPQPGTQVTLSPVFTPAHLKGMVINPKDPFKFDFVVSRGDEALTATQKQDEYSKLVKYFLAALAVPDTDQWVNLSPYEKDRIIPDGFGLTEMGRDLLAQDYLLKQISASLTNPDTDLGKKFWNGVYEQAYQKHGTTEIPTDTFNKIWITPDKAVVYEKGNSVIVLEQHLKVMLESDYKAMKENAVSEVADNDAVKISKQVMRDVILPAIEKEVNEGKSFAPLRQVYSGMLLATWYKIALKESVLGKLYADKGKVKGVDQDPKNNQEIYSQYVQAFKKGVFNMIKEDVDRYSQEVIPRKYFSGGAENVFGQILERIKGGKELPAGVEAHPIKDGDEVVGVRLVNVSDDYFKTLKEEQGKLGKNVERLGDGDVRVDAAITLLNYSQGYEALSKLFTEAKKWDALSQLERANKDVEGLIKVAQYNLAYTDGDVTHQLAIIWQGLRNFNAQITGSRSRGLGMSLSQRSPYLDYAMNLNIQQDPAMNLASISLTIGLGVASLLAPNLLVAQPEGSTASVVGAFDNGRTSVQSVTFRNNMTVRVGHIANLAIGPFFGGPKIITLAKLVRIETGKGPFDHRQVAIIWEDISDTSRNGQNYIHTVSPDFTDMPKDYYDEAQETNVDNAAKGGIDFAQSNLDMQIKRDGAGVPLPISEQNLDNIHIDGLVPVILNIRPAAGAPVLSQLTAVGTTAA